MNSSNEQDLLKGAQHFDPQVLAGIYDRYSTPLYYYALRLLGDNRLAEDCVAETFSRLLKALRGGQGPRDHLQAYLYRVAHNWITDQYRRQPPPPLELDEDFPEGDQLRPEHLADEHIEQEQMRAALSHLTPEQRQVISLRFIEDWENEEVAAALCKPIGAVKALQHRALAALRRILDAPKEKMV
jgi:RNA polymerase sigma-70 factor, ECF subfamily